MDLPNLNIELDGVWHKVPSDSSKCLICEDECKEEMYQYFIFEVGNTNPIETSRKICVPCFEQCDDEDG